MPSSHIANAGRVNCSGLGTMKLIRLIWSMPNPKSRRRFCLIGSMGIYFTISMFRSIRNKQKPVQSQVRQNARKCNVHISQMQEGSAVFSPCHIVMMDPGCMIRRRFRFGHICLPILHCHCLFAASHLLF